MIWYSLDSLIEGLYKRGFTPVRVNDPACFVLRSPKKRVIYPKVVLPMNQGDWLPELVVRKLLSEVGFNVEELLKNIETRSEVS